MVNMARTQLHTEHHDDVRSVSSVRLRLARRWETFSSRCLTTLSKGAGSCDNTCSCMERWGEQMYHTIV